MYTPLLLLTAVFFRVVSAYLFVTCFYLLSMGKDVSKDFQTNNGEKRADVASMNKFVVVASCFWVERIFS